MSRTGDDCDRAIALFDKMVGIVGEVHKSFIHPMSSLRDAARSLLKNYFDF
ncbi:hypothetical protein [Nostoc sp.]|uniref:hypothetical protein n=1 Tax=Nostoc sp. TaxID=1180 RepID=UPI002FF6A42E